MALHAVNKEGGMKRGQQSDSWEASNQIGGRKGIDDIGRFRASQPESQAASTSTTAPEPGAKLQWEAPDQLPPFVGAVDAAHIPRPPAAAGLAIVPAQAEGVVGVWHVRGVQPDVAVGGEPKALPLPAVPVRPVRNARGTPLSGGKHRHRSPGCSNFEMLVDRPARGDQHVRALRGGGHGAQGSRVSRVRVELVVEQLQAQHWLPVQITRHAPGQQEGA